MHLLGSVIHLWSLNQIMELYNGIMELHNYLWSFINIYKTPTLELWSFINRIMKLYNFNHGVP